MTNLHIEQKKRLERIAQIYTAGEMTAAEIAAEFGVTERTVQRAVQRYRQSYKRSEVPSK
jgi:DNA-binding transcriptional regulator LsrR (DeoR family)